MSKVIADEEYLNILKKYSSHFRDLMKIVRNSGYELRGAVENPSDRGKKDLLNKQRNLYSISKKCNKIIDIEFNGGFSSLIMLLSNRTVEVTAFDTGNEKYVDQCFKYLKKQFPKRINLIK